MDKKMFNELLASVQEARAIVQGEVAPSRVFEVSEVDVKSIRAQYKLSQQEFAALLGVSVKTLRNWEQGRRSPEGLARVLLLVHQTPRGDLGCGGAGGLSLIQSEQQKMVVQR